MTDWALRIPHKFRDESLIDVGFHCRHLPADERDVAFTIVMDAAIDGMKTAGELLDHLEVLEPAQRRGMLDQARAKAGLDATADVDDQEAWQAIQGRPMDTIRKCAEPSCGQYPCRPGGGFYTPDVKRWHCPEHEHLAAPGDMEPRGSGLRYAPGGAIVVDDPADDAFERRREERDRDRHRVELEVRAVEHAEMVASKEASDAAARSTLPPHLREPRLA